jgi:hypothetical protein
MPLNLGTGTNESRVVFLNRAAVEIYERGPFVKITPQTGTGTLQSNLVVYGYVAIAAVQPKLISVVSSTGMIVQAGY